MRGYRPNPMDSLDTRILRELTQATGVVPARPGLSASYRTIGRALRVSPGTVRNRVNRMRLSGVLTGSSVYANPSLLGLEASAYALEVAPDRTKADVVEQLRGLEGMLFIQNFRGSLLGLAFVHADAASRKRVVEAIRRITGAPGGVISAVGYPPCHATLSPSEWKLLSRLMRGSFSTYASLAHELGVSARTIKRRVAKLVHTQAVLSVPTMDYRALSGCIPADLVVAFSSPEERHGAERKVLDLVGDRMIYAGLWADFSLYSLLLPKVSAASELAAAVPRIPGIAISRVEIVDEHIDLVQGLRAYVDRRWASENHPRSGA
jgi:DNA-binding Lrp family transcriptional regulator